MPADLHPAITISHQRCPTIMDRAHQFRYTPGLAAWIAMTKPPSLHAITFGNRLSILWRKSTRECTQSAGCALA
jgi:hypothetical protein